MDELAKIIVSVISGVILALLARMFEPKVKIVYWSAGQFLFQLPPQPPADPNGPRFVLMTHAITIQNIGRKHAEGIEIAHRQKPDHFKLDPALTYEENTAPEGTHIVRVRALGAKEFFTIQFLSYLTVPELLYIRSSAGRAEPIVTQQFRIFPRWLNLSMWLFVIVGAGFLTYWIIKALIFVLRGAGVVSS